MHDDLQQAKEEAFGVRVSRNALMKLATVEPTFSFRHKLFVVSCLATFRPDKEISELFEVQFSFPLPANKIAECRSWMTKLTQEPGTGLKGKAAKWKELWEHFQEIRRQYLEGISEIPLAHPRRRVEELVKLYDFSITPQPSKVLVTKEHLRTRTGQLRFSMTGRPYMEEQHHVIHERDIGIAASILKQIGQESGNFVEKTETTLNLAEFVRKQQKERGLVQDATIVSEEVNPDFGVPQTEMPLRGPVKIELFNQEQTEIEE